MRIVVYVVDLSNSTVIMAKNVKLRVYQSPQDH
jgi:hypothetical protein